ncbi:hypothetical protein J7K50_02115 [bacterium]|nr:hypothetical protein [bacterium]
MFEQLPALKMTHWGNLRQITHYRAMKAIQKCDSQQLNKVIEEWRTEYQGIEYYTYLSYYRSWLYILDRTDDNWLKAEKTFAEYRLSSEMQQTRTSKVRSVLATMLWCASIRSDLAMAQSLAELLPANGEPQETIDLALSFAQRDLETCRELLPCAISALNALDSDELYTEFLIQLSCEAYLEETVT